MCMTNAAIIMDSDIWQRHPLKNLTKIYGYLKFVSSGIIFTSSDDLPIRGKLFILAGTL